MTKTVVQAPAAGAPVGPYSQAVMVDGSIFVSAEKGVDPATGKIVPSGVPAQTEQTLKNIRSILEAAGASLEAVVRLLCSFRYQRKLHSKRYMEFFEGGLGKLFYTKKVPPACLKTPFNSWRRRMGIEPTQDGTSALLTVLKTAEPTRTLPPPGPGFSSGLLVPLMIHRWDLKWKSAKQG